MVPPTPGVLSALGGLIADLKSDFIKTLYANLDAATGITMRDEFAALKVRALEWLRRDQGFDGTYTLTYSAELRYRGQSFEIDTAIDAEAVEAGGCRRGGRMRSTPRMSASTGHADRHAGVQVISLRLVIAGKTTKPEFPRHPLQSGAATPIRRAEGWIDGAERMIDLYRRVDLRPGQTFAGPAVVTQDDCTTVVPPGLRVRVDEYANLRITREAAR